VTSGLVILLPPSEGKAESVKGSKLDLSKLSFPLLKPARVKLLQELVELSQKQPGKAQKLLGLSNKQLGELEMNKNLLKRPTAKAIEIYSGVLYEALDFSGLSKVAQSWIGKKVFIASALYGLIGAFDKISAYRLSGDQALPNSGSVKKYWQTNLSQTLDETFKRNLILDLRSSVYAASWQPSEDLKNNCVVGKVVQKVKLNGKFVYKTVSHHNKATKGKLVAALAKASANPKSAVELEKSLKKLGIEAKLEPKQEGKPHTMTIVMP
jgi:uncharacterized protein